MTRITDYFWI